MLRLKTAVKRLLGVGKPYERIRKSYDEEDYLTAYSKHTDARVEHDAHAAVGGMWQELGKLQFDFLIDKALQPHHRLLDIGCGTLRGGRLFIGYMDAGNYSGIDISSKAITYARQLVQEEGLSEKYPRVLVSGNKDLRFREFTGKAFDYLLAQSVFTHLKPEHVGECFEHIGRIMAANSLFYFTFNKAGKHEQTGLKDFHYPFSFFSSLADQYGFRLKDCSSEYNHPKGQQMVEMTIKENAGRSAAG